jgi:integrase
MAGSLRQLPSGAWHLRVFVGRDDRGRVLHRTRTVHGSKREAERELSRMVIEFERGGLEVVDRDPAGMRWGPSTTINDAIEGWRLNGWDDLSPTTRRRYEGIWGRYVRDSIGRRRIAVLTPWDVERYLRRLKDEHALSQASVRYTRAMLHRACRLARKWSNGNLPNPVADTEMPEWSFDEQRDAVRAPTVEEVREILEAAERYDDRLGAFFRITAASGGRRGEVAALRWSDVDWKRETLRFDESVVTGNGAARVKQPKTRGSVRTLAVDAATMATLAALFQKQKAEARACDLTVEENAFVFSVEPDGTIPPHPDALTKGFRRVCQLAGVADDIHLHSLRHFQSTELDAVISEAQKQVRMGWTTVQMARRYTDMVSEEDRKAAEHIGQLLGGSNSSQLLTDPANGLR